MLWNQHVQTDRTIPNTELNLTIRDNEEGACVLIDVDIAGGRHVVMKDTEKTLKHRGLIIEIKRMLNGKTKVIPLIRGATRTSFQIIQKISESHIGKARN
jgi:hypothetical protein